jgi:hypothetical protein
MSKLYYTPPSEEQFNELREKAIEIWKTYSDDGGYSSGKIDKIKDLKNVGDNFMYMVAMFDIYNQAKLAGMLSEKTRQAFNERMIDGGNPPEYNPFLTA